MPLSDHVIDDQGFSTAPKFDVRKFYANVISMDEEDMGYADDLLGIDGAQSRIFELMRRIRQKEFKRRAQGKCMFGLTPSSQIALSFFSTVLQAKKPGPKKVNAVNNKELRSTQRFIC